MSLFALMEPAVIEHQVSSGPCYASLTGDEIILGNERIEQRWRISRGLLLPAGMRERISVDDWVDLPQPPAPRPTRLVPDSMGEIHFATTGGPYYADEPASLQVELRFPFAADPIAADSEPRVILIYSFQIFPASSSILIELETVFL